MVELKIDLGKCTGCGTCVDICPVKMYSLKNKKATVTGKKAECIVCRACESSCPIGAISVSE